MKKRTGIRLLAVFVIALGVPSAHINAQIVATFDDIYSGQAPGQTKPGW